MKRRTFILTAIAVTAAASVPVSGLICSRSLPGDPLSRPDVLSRFCNKKAICEIGSHYLSCVPAEAEEERLKKLILTDNAGNEAIASDPSSIGDWINQRTSQDYGANRTVIIDGWVISITEARQCALLSLANN
ncbi:MAG TPA: hypothetical protein VIZ28_03920 [Chitinophagaceae bacterium]